MDEHYKSYYNAGVKDERLRIKRLIDRLDEETWGNIMDLVYRQDSGGQFRQILIKSLKDECDGRKRLVDAINSTV